MFVTGFPAAAFDTNCYVVAAGPGEQCVVVDPGIGVGRRLDDLLAEHRLTPVAVLLTHGHVDHTFSVAPVCAARGVPAYLHPADRGMLADPATGLFGDADGGPGLVGQWWRRQQPLAGGRLTWAEPDDVRPLPDGGAVEIAGLAITVEHAPGHTGGSVLFRLPGGVDEPPVCLSGDVLLAGSIGRTDLPGGDAAAMRATLRDRILPLPDETVVLPGHGPATTVGRERAGNPLLVEVATTPPG